MRELLLLLISIALFETVILCFAEGERMRRVVRLVGGSAMALALLSTVMRFDYAAYAASLRREALEMQTDTDEIRDEAQRLNRSLIEEACAAYIRNRAKNLGVALQDVQVKLAWDVSGFWYPEEAELTLAENQQYSAALQDAIQTELGIAPDAQHWRKDGQANELEETAG